MEHLLAATRHEFSPSTVIHQAEKLVAECGDKAIGGISLGFANPKLFKLIRHTIEIMPTDGRPVLVHWWVLDNNFLCDLTEHLPYPVDEFCCLATGAAEQFGRAGVMTKWEYVAAPPMLRAIDDVIWQCTEPISDKNQHWPGVYTGDESHYYQVLSNVISQFDSTTEALGPHIPKTLDIPYLDVYPGSIWKSSSVHLLSRLTASMKRKLMVWGRLTVLKMGWWDTNIH